MLDKSESLELYNTIMQEVECIEKDEVEICYFNTASPEKPDDNHDSMLISHSDSSRWLLCIADGAGGHRHPAMASSSLLSKINEHLKEQSSHSLDSIVEAIEQASEYIRLNYHQSRSTLAMAILDGNMLRCLHIGDSKLAIIGGRGRLKFETIGHNLYELSNDCGLADYFGEELEVPSNIVTNLAGDPIFRMDLSPKIELAPNDTLILGSDGLFDNISTEELTELCKGGELRPVANEIKQACRKRMLSSDEQEAYHPDDLSFILLRRKSQT